MAESKGLASARSQDFVSDRLKPKNQEESAQRALFLATALALAVSRLLNEYVNHCSKSHLAKTGSPLELGFAQEQFNAVAKEILSVSVWLSIFENIDDELPDWLKAMIVQCLRLADRLRENPTSKEVMNKYDMTIGVAPTCELLSINVCSALNLGATADDALVYLRDRLLNDAQLRRQYLYWALTEPIEELDKRIKSGALGSS